LDTTQDQLDKATCHAVYRAHLVSRNYPQLYPQYRCYLTDVCESKHVLGYICSGHIWYLVFVLHGGMVYLILPSTLVLMPLRLFSILSFLAKFGNGALESLVWHLLELGSVL